MTATSIEWTDKTWNPVRGCARVSPGCERCYAERVAHRFSGAGLPYEGLTVLGKHGPRWAGSARFVPEMLDAPLRWRKPQRVFVNSMSDLFHADITNEQIAAVFGVMAACPQHTFQILTKRPERMQGWFEWSARAVLARSTENTLCLHYAQRDCSHTGLLDAQSILMREWPLRNVWLGVSCEDQARADERIPLLLQTPAALRFVSAEPLLGPIRFDGWLDDEPSPASLLDWVIVGGESGPGARPCEVQWIRNIVHQCAAEGTVCFVKQLGLHAATSEVPTGGLYSKLRLRDRKGGDMAEFPIDLQVREFPEVNLANMVANEVDSGWHEQDDEES